MSMVYVDFEDLSKRAASDKEFQEKAFDIAKDLKYDGYQRALASVVIKCFDKNFNVTSTNTETGINFPNQWLAGELQKLIIKKIKSYIHLLEIKDIF